MRERLIENREPQRIAVANFDVRDQGRMPVPNPDFMPRDSSVTLDLRGPNLNVIPIGPEFETTVYNLRF